MQKTLKSFFKFSPSPKSTPQNSNSDDLFDGIRVPNPPEIHVKYTREALDSLSYTREFCNREFHRGEAIKCGLTGEEKSDDRQISEVVRSEGKSLSKKRSYAQFHLELGQSDFLLHTCKVCGIKYAKGDVADEKFHTSFHKKFTHGLPFKGWRNERVIVLPLLEKDRVILVLDNDPPAQKKKVQEVVKMMEIELGDGWIFHELCKVFLYVSSQRITGCVVVEPINTAHKVISDSVDKKVSDGSSRKEAVSKPSTLRFGDICFQREVSKKRGSGVLDSDTNALESIVCEEEASPACCGIRTIWVTPSNRRKRIATHLLDAVRKSFIVDRLLERSELAFSQPTSTGKALALKYSGTGSFLVYKAG